MRSRVSEVAIATRRSAQPDLYPAEGESPPLHGQRCRACARVAFPPNPYGCEACGSTDLEPQALAGAGTLEAFATVHQYAGRGIEAPFVIGLVLLDDGPALRATLTARSDAGLAIGQRVRSALVPAGSDEQGEIVELRFAPAEASR